MRTEMDKVLRNDFDVTVMKALETQKRIAARNYLHRPKAKDGFGERTMEVHAVFDAIWRLHYGRNYTENKDLLRFLMRRNPEVVVRSRGTKIQVGYGTCGESRKPVGLINQPTNERKVCHQHH